MIATCIIFSRGASRSRSGRIMAALRGAISPARSPAATTRRVSALWTSSPGKKRKMQDGAAFQAYIQLAQVSLGVALSAYLVHFVTIRLEKVINKLVEVIEGLVERVEKCPRRE